MVATLDVGSAKLRTPALVVPIEAVVSPSDGSKSFSVFVVTHQGDKDTVHRRTVQPGPAFGNMVSIVARCEPRRKSCDQRSDAGERRPGRPRDPVMKPKSKLHRALHAPINFRRTSGLNTTDATSLRLRLHPARAQHCALLRRKSPNLVDFADRHRRARHLRLRQNAEAQRSQHSGPRRIGTNAMARRRRRTSRTTRHAPHRIDHRAKSQHPRPQRRRLRHQVTFACRAFPSSRCSSPTR